MVVVIKKNLESLKSFVLVCFEHQASLFFKLLLEKSCISFFLEGRKLSKKPQKLVAKTCGHVIFENVSKNQFGRFY